MNAQDLLQHYKNVRGRISSQQAPKPVVIQTQPKPPAPPPVQPYQNKEPDRLIFRDERKAVSMENFLRWFEANKDRCCAEIKLPKEARAIVSKIVRKHGLTIDEAFCYSRVQFLSDCRHEVWFALIANGFTYAETGRMFSRDHTSVLHGSIKWRETSGRQYTDYIANPGAVARRLSLRFSNVPKSQAHAEVLKIVRRLGAVAAGGAGGDLPEVSPDHVG